MYLETCTTCGLRICFQQKQIVKILCSSGKIFKKSLTLGSCLEKLSQTQLLFGCSLRSCRLLLLDSPL